MLLCTLAGYAVSQARPEIINGGVYALDRAIFAEAASTRVPQAWHSGHRPCHFIAPCPQSLQW